jgi:hypothetical protein
LCIILSLILSESSALVPKNCCAGLAREVYECGTAYGPDGVATRIRNLCNFKTHLQRLISEAVF